MGSAPVPRRKKPAVAIADHGVLPPDVLFEVLLRFPANMLCRLRLVCRSWRSLTSDPVFARAHTSRHPLLVGHHAGPFFHHEVRVMDLFGNIVKRMPVPRSSGAMNTQLDMVCVSAMLPQRPAGTVLNLATGEVVADAIVLPRRDAHPLSFAGPTSPFLLGHIPSTGELKVFYSHMYTVRSEEGNDRAVQACNITTLGSDGDSGRWRVKVSSPAQITSHSTGRVVIGGVAYFLSWMLYNGNINLADAEPDAIAVFDLATEEWRPAMLRGPLSSRLTRDDEKLKYYRHRSDVKLAAVDGCLVTAHHNRGQQVDLWFLVDMDVDKGLWIKRYSIPLRGFYAFGAPYPLLILDDGRIVMWEERSHMMSVFDPRANKWAELATLATYAAINMYQGNLLCSGLQR